MQSDWEQLILERLTIIYDDNYKELLVGLQAASQELSFEEYQACTDDASDVYDQSDRLAVRAWVCALFGESIELTEPQASHEIPEPYRDALLQYSRRKIRLSYSYGQEVRAGLLTLISS